jgi:hypothetical protein
MSSGIETILANASVKPQVAYVPYRTFKSAIELLEQHGLPNRIDRTLWPSFSGVIQSQLIAAFRFFSLIKPDGVPTPKLELLVRDKSNRKGHLQQMLKEAYPTLMAIDLTKATIGQFNDAMRKYELSPETTKKASSFFLQAAKDAGLPMSKHILDKTRAVRKRKPVSATSRNGSTSTAGTTSSSSGRPGRTVLLDAGVELTLTTSADTFSMTKNDREFVSRLLDLLDQYEDEHGEETELLEEGA